MVRPIHLGMTRVAFLSREGQGHFGETVLSPGQLHIHPLVLASEGVGNKPPVVE